MAIMRQAEKYKIVVEDTYKCIVGKKLLKNSTKMTLEALNGNLNLSSNKKVIGNGGV
ncbi:hypothetical protein GCM10022393_19400 [Aquimarina addita]|uniref:Uncharacterized protein n=1 Tax=Aquimarina addita TaxID=870485 RepID=A0ABP6UKI2_9FLAO